ncbi:hypothetical protein [Hymenobacter properus]|uniref:Uncharacterized protein n=1 Tax=Hymenobacter properus TaxID=2791026 RepID=A0A931BCK7_9BACT|nr:hypothetical protein [Hymenobacter properus]MBF9140198.1 hypothetical protein [Hymenobacter properus]MBR7719005.1 hypothetical protein [Microvirga sp. SRT04]
MGLDINLSTDNQAIQEAEATDEDLFYQHSLSRTFCNLIGRQDMDDPELNQIGRLTGIDISPFYEMTAYPSEEHLEFKLRIAEDEAERQSILEEAAEDKARAAGNLDRVLATVEGLLNRLAPVDNLPSLLKNEGFTSGDYEPYFGNFLTDTGDGYIGNNFGQDLRNLKRHLNYIKAAGGTTVFFEFG